MHKDSRELKVPEAPPALRVIQVHKDSKELKASKDHKVHKGR